MTCIEKSRGRKTDFDCLLGLYSVSPRYLDAFLLNYIRIMSYCS